MTAPEFFYTDLSTIDGKVIYRQRQAAKMAILVRNAREDSCSLARANLTRAVLKRVDLSFADLRDAKLQDADLEGSDLTGANLSKADLSGALLGNVDLAGSDLRRANILEAKTLVGADLTDAKGLPGELMSMIALLDEDEDWIVTEQIWDTVRANPKQAEAA